jgi:hypothetical protein
MITDYRMIAACAGHCLRATYVPHSSRNESSSVYSACT